MKNNYIFPYNKGFTHAGSFHSDDIFATAFLRILNPNIKIIRGFQVPEGFEGIVYDIGDGEFDHHSKDRELRENGVPYAAFGKLWRKFAPYIVSESVVKAIDKELVMPLDYTDNYGKPNPLSSIMSNFNAFWTENGNFEEQNKRFFEAVELAKMFLLRYIEKFEVVEQAEEYLNVCYKNSSNGIVILDKYAPWQDKYKKMEDVKVVIYPSNRGGWNAERVENHGFEFPEEWWGTRGVSGINGLVFCHATGFMSSFDNKENAVNIVNKLMELRCKDA